jgi:hypothetical protein
MERVVPNLFASILSNTSEVQDPEGSTEPYYRIRQYDMNLRKHALKLLVDEVAQIGRHPEARELIRIQVISKTISADWEKYNSARSEFQEFYRTLMVSEVARGGDEGSTDAEFSFADLSAFEQPRNQFESGYTSLDGERVLAADVSTDVNGVKTATGLLIRNNLNVAEDFYEAIAKTRAQIQDEIFRVGLDLDSVQAVAYLDRKRNALRRYITGEQLFLREMYRAYSGEK